MKPKGLVEAGLSRIEAVRTRTVLDPLLWLLGLSLPLLLSAAVLVPSETARLLLIGMAGICILLTFVAYFLTLFRDPERLQSEDYRVRQRAIQLLRKTGAAQNVVDIVNQVPRSKVEKGEPR